MADHEYMGTYFDQYGAEQDESSEEEDDLFANNFLTTKGAGLPSVYYPVEDRAPLQDEEEIMPFEEDEDQNMEAASQPNSQVPPELLHREQNDEDADQGDAVKTSRAQDEDADKRVEPSPADEDSQEEGDDVQEQEKPPSSNFEVKGSKNRKKKKADPKLRKINKDHIQIATKAIHKESKTLCFSSIKASAEKRWITKNDLRKALNNHDISLGKDIPTQKAVLKQMMLIAHRLSDRYVPARWSGRGRYRSSESDSDESYEGQSQAPASTEKQNRTNIRASKPEEAVENKELTAKEKSELLKIQEFEEFNEEYAFIDQKTFGKLYDALKIQIDSEGRVL